MDRIDGPTFRQEHPPVTEHLFALERDDWRPPLFMFEVTDASGRLLEISVYDPDDVR